MIRPSSVDQPFMFSQSRKIRQLTLRGGYLAASQIK
jgi:hypothetical protein